MKRLLLPVATIAGLAGPAAWADEHRISVTVDDLTCPSCAYIVASSMRSVPSVAIVAFRQGRARDQGVYVVTYDDRAANPDMIIAAVTANGYPARLLPDDRS
jgi:mercuric ion binding protein